MSGSRALQGGRISLYKQAPRDWVAHPGPCRNTVAWERTDSESLKSVPKPSPAILHHVLVACEILTRGRSFMMMLKFCWSHMLKSKRAWEFCWAQVGIRMPSTFLTQNLNEEVAHARTTANSKWRSSSFRWNWRNFVFAGDKSYKSLLCCGQKINKSRYGQLQNIWGRSVLPLLLARNRLSAQVQGFVFLFCFLKYVMGRCFCFIEEFNWVLLGSGTSQ